MSAESIGRYFPLLGTDVEIRVTASQLQQARAVEERVVAEIVRLQGLFNVYDQDSALSGWRSGRTDQLPPEVVEVLAMAERWYAASGGAFHPAAGALRARWVAAAQTGVAPTPDEAAALAASLAPLPYTVSPSGQTRRLADTSGVDLNAVAKGWICDRAADLVAGDPGVSRVIVNAGGDIRHLGEPAVEVAIEDPSTPVDNAPPLARLALTHAGLATSGRARRGFQVGEQWFGHVLDPRSGWPVEHTASVTVIASCAALADVAATVLGVCGPDAVAGLDLPTELAWLVVDHGGVITRSPGWPS